jgi:hypothetical protein
LKKKKVKLTTYFYSPIKSKPSSKAEYETNKKKEAKCYFEQIYVRKNDFSLKIES